MTLQPIIDAPVVVQAHLAAALVALVIGISVLLMKKGTAQHMFAGRIWVATMVFVAASSFFIKASGHFSAIHGLSAFTLVMLPLAIWYRRQGNIRGHAITMIGTFSGLFIAGAFTLLPYRILGKALFGQ